MPGKGPGPHRHPYDEIQFVREGRGLWTVNGHTFAMKFIVQWKGLPTAQQSAIERFMKTGGALPPDGITMLAVGTRSAS